MIETLRELIKNHKGEYTDWEAYTYTDSSKRLSTDFIKSIENVNLEAEVEDWWLMDQAEYNDTILSNSSVKADFGEWYDDAAAKVLVVVVKPRDAWRESSIVDGDGFEKELDVEDLDEAVLDSLSRFNALAAGDQKRTTSLVVEYGTIEPEEGINGSFDNVQEACDLSTFAKRLSALVDILGYTQKDTAETIGVPLRTLENWIGGVNTPPVITQIAVINGLIQEVRNR